MIKFLKGLEEIEIYDKNKKYFCDLLIFLDFVIRDRIGEIGRNIESRIIINIDYYVSNLEYGDIVCVIVYFFLIFEIIYNFIKYMEYKFFFLVVEVLYLGLVNDIGNFFYSNVKVGIM